MPSQSALPPLNQRPQLLSRFDLPQIDTKQTNITNTSTTLEAANTQVVQRVTSTETPRFPTETVVDSFRGEVRGRNVDEIRGGQSLSDIPNQVQPFNSATAQGFLVEGLTPAEAAAVGYLSPQQNAETDRLPINGSGEIVDNKPTEEDETTDQINSDRRVEESRLDSVQQQISQEDQATEEAATSNTPNTEPTDRGGEPLTQDEIQEIKDLERRDREVRTHEQAHVSAGGQYIRGGIKLSYQQGPDGKTYAVGGEVDIDLGRESTPEATITKMRQVRAAALAPANPSGADRAAAATASQREQEARKEIADQQRTEQRERAQEARESRQKAKELKATNKAKSTEESESSDSFAGAQGVNPDRASAPRPSAIDNRSLDTYTSYPLESKPELARPVSGVNESLNTDSSKEISKSASLENASVGYDTALHKALKSFDGHNNN